ncbi:MAG: PTS fructose transporter subunit IIA [Chromatiales bacterium]
MSIGILIITHSGIGSALLETATSMLGVCPLNTETLAVTPDSDPDLLLKQAQGMVEDLDRGDGVLVLTDMFGSTPSNIATRLRRPGRVAVVAGINLPMLVRVLNYPTLDLQALVDTAVSGGNRGVLCCRRPDKRGAGTA